LLSTLAGQSLFLATVIHLGDTIATIGCLYCC